MIFEDLSITFGWRILYAVPGGFDLITCHIFTWGKFHFKGWERNRIFHNEQIELFQNTNLQIPSIPSKLLKHVLSAGHPDGILICGMGQAVLESHFSLVLRTENPRSTYFYSFYFVYYTRSNVHSEWISGQTRNGAQGISKVDRGWGGGGAPNACSLRTKMSPISWFFGQNIKYIELVPPPMGWCLLLRWMSWIPPQSGI